MRQSPGVKIKFAMLQPNQVITSSQTPAYVYSCIYYQIGVFPLDAMHTHIPSVPVYNKDFQASCMVSSETDSLLVQWMHTVSLSLWEFLFFLRVSILYQMMTCWNQNLSNGWGGKRWRDVLLKRNNCWITPLRLFV